ASSCTGTISISFSGAAASQLYQGTYSDNITFSYRRNGSLVSTQALTLTSQVVGSTVSLTINGNAVASSLPLTTVQTSLLVGTATEASNSNTGYLIQARSANAGKLTNAASNISYTLKYGSSGAISLTTSNVTVYTVPAGLYSSNSSNLTISYTPPASMAAGTYSDVITFTIAAQ
ncbi:MAG: hypothetical protein H7333_10680, partial [Bdellovibrionales bacterium]|nr:hypothetical protein [Oligoflexia bacterium]